MENQDFPAEDNVQSTDLDTGAVLDDLNLDGELEGFDEFFADMASPESEPEAVEDDHEVSEDNELTPSDDDTPDIDDDSDEEVAEDEAEDTPDSIVDFNEMKEHQFEIDGKVYSANDLKAALGRQSKQEEARKEVEAATTALQEREARVAALENMGNQNLAMIQKRTELESRHQQYNQLKAAQNEYAKKGDTAKWQQAEMKLRPLQEYIAQEEAKLSSDYEEFNAQNTQVQMGILQERGFGDMLSDSQRVEALGKYVDGIHPSLSNLVNTNAYVFEMAEKARLYDQAQSAGKNRKLKGSSKKTLRGGAGGPKPATKKSSDPFMDQIDKMFK